MTESSIQLIPRMTPETLQRAAGSGDHVVDDIRPQDSISQVQAYVEKPSFKTSEVRGASGGIVGDELDGSKRRVEELYLARGQPKTPPKASEQKGWITPMTPTMPKPPATCPSTKKMSKGLPTSPPPKQGPVRMTTSQVKVPVRPTTPPKKGQPSAKSETSWLVMSPVTPTDQPKATPKEAAKATPKETTKNLPKPVPETCSEVCIACHGSGMVTSTLNHRMFRLLAGTRVSSEGNEPGSDLSKSDKLTTFVPKGVKGLFVEIGCGQTSVLLNACLEMQGVAYVGIHDELQSEEVFLQVKEIVRRVHTPRPCEQGPQKHVCGIHVRISLPYVVMSFSKKDVSTHVDTCSVLLKNCEQYLALLEEGSDSVSVDFPKMNQSWKMGEVERFLERYKMIHTAEIHSCSMGIATRSGLKVGKMVQLCISNEVLAMRLQKRFECKCVEDHASFNAVDYKLTERYSRRFARFFVRSWWELVLSRSLTA